MAFLAGVNGIRKVFLDDRPLNYGSEWVVGWPLAWSADGRTIACPLRNLKTGCSGVGLNGRLQDDTFDSVGALALSRNGKVLAYRAREGEHSFLVVGGVKGPAFDHMIDPAISDDGDAIAFAGSREGQWSLIAGDRKRPLQERPFSVFVSPSGAAVGYVLHEPLSKGGSVARVVVDGARGETFSLVGRPTFSFDGQTYAYAADEGLKRYVVIRRRRIEAPGRITDPVFSPDGRRIGYGARIGRELWWKVEDVD
ncbi:MAG: PD40 domain-containing protein [Planctomycetes bacterium]|nr:PD40 domain-containing protein [Planctomycetota bacterium]